MIQKFKRLIILIRIIFKVISSGKANKEVLNPKNILIIQTAKMGDMVCTTPMFRAVKNKFPNSVLTVVGDNLNKEILLGNPDVDNYVIWNKKDPISLIEEIKKYHFDFACITAPNFEGLALLLLSDIKLVVCPKIENGKSPYETRPYRIIRRFAVTKPHSMGTYAPREYLRLLEPIGIFSEDTKKTLYYSDNAKKRVEEFFAKNNVEERDFLVGVSPSAGNKIKRWPEEHFAGVADYLKEKYKAKILIFGGSKDLEEVQNMLKHIKSPDNVINTLGEFNIDELKYAVSKMNLFISVDTGPIYIAEAFGVPTIDIVGPIDEKEQPPIDDTHIVVVPERKKPELYVMNARVYDTQEATRQANSVTVDQVKEAIDLLIPKLNVKR